MRGLVQRKIRNNTLARTDDRDWCRFNRTGTSYIDPGSPWQNPWTESFNGKLRDELLSGEVFDTLLEAKALAEDFRIDYNWKRPH